PREQAALLDAVERRAIDGDQELPEAVPFVFVREPAEGLVHERERQLACAQASKQLDAAPNVAAFHIQLEAGTAVLDGIVVEAQRGLEARERRGTFVRRELDSRAMKPEIRVVGLRAQQLLDERR